MRNFSFLFFLLFFSQIHSQTRPLPPIIKKLIASKGEIVSIPHSSNFLVSIQDLPEMVTRNQQQYIIKRYGQLFVFTTNTGRVYRLEIQGDRYGWTRIDSTYYTGYNSRCLFFCLDSNFYSFGGEGFWYTNGDLRIFNKKVNEWDAITVSDPITREFPVNHDLKKTFFIDAVGKKLILVGPDLHPSYLINRQKDAPYKKKLFSLDVRTGIWKELGKYNFRRA